MSTAVTNTSRNQVVYRQEIGKIIDLKLHCMGCAREIKVPESRRAQLRSACSQETCVTVAPLVQQASFFQTLMNDLKSLLSDILLENTIGSQHQLSELVDWVNTQKDILNRQKDGSFFDSKKLCLECTSEGKIKSSSLFQTDTVFLSMAQVSFWDKEGGKECPISIEVNVSGNDKVLTCFSIARNVMQRWARVNKMTNLVLLHAAVSSLPEKKKVGTLDIQKSMREVFSSALGNKKLQFPSERGTAHSENGRTLMQARLHKKWCQEQFKKGFGGKGSGNQRPPAPS